MKHWTRFLSEVGTIATHQGSAQESKQIEMQVLKDRLYNLKRNYKREEQSIKQIALGDWTLEEIKAAKQEAKNTKPLFHIVITDF